MTAKLSSEKNDLILLLHKIGAIKLGKFKLKSGLTSPIYLDLQMIISFPDCLRLVAQTLWNSLPTKDFDLLCGVPYTALPIATCLALQHNKPMILRRKEKKSFDSEQQIQGMYQPGQSCLLIEDVITTGASILETALDLEANGLQVKNLAVFIDREQGGSATLTTRNYAVHAALSITDILTYLLQSNTLTDFEKDLITLA